MRVQQIHFAHSPGAADSALGVRHDFETPIVGPEYCVGQTSKPVVYARDAVAKAPIIKVKFAGGPADSSVRVRAAPSSAYIDLVKKYWEDKESLFMPIEWIKNFLLRVNTHVLGQAVSPSVVSFDASGNSIGENVFRLGTHGLHIAPVDIHCISWSWEMLDDGEWRAFDRTDHKIYTVIDTPFLPWNRQGESGILEQTQPWVKALDLACLWARGATTIDEVAAMITRAINGIPNQSYDAGQNFGVGLTFNLTSYLNELETGIGWPCNCVDFAHAVASFTNILGGELWPIELLDNKYNNELRKLVVAGKDVDIPENWEAPNWSFHKICRRGADVSKDDPVYDACIHLDVDDNYEDDNHEPGIPIGMSYGSAGQTGTYHGRLVKSGTIMQVAPMPGFPLFLE
ncbi:MAG: hypothetical protein GY854_04615 [Deltaproteobacteria bacterium]|nr:hypothetical protein [Deltaproteobacteria bacterium]